MNGVVVSYDQEKSYGFIRPSSGGQDIFFHISEFPGKSSVRIGTRVAFEVEHSSRGYKAKNLSAAPLSLSIPDLGPRMRFAVIVLTAVALGTVSLIFGGQVHPAIAYLVSCNVVAFAICGYDKGIAGGDSTRVPEIVLFGTALIGGTAGLLFGMTFFRHKTQKASFHCGLALVVLVQVLVARHYWEVIKSFREGAYSAYEQESYLGGSYQGEDGTLEDTEYLE